MKKLFKIIVGSILVFIVIIGGVLAGVYYKVKNGFPVSYETEKPNIDFPQTQPAILLFSKSTGNWHKTSFDASKLLFQDLAKKNNWFL